METGPRIGHERAKRTCAIAEWKCPFEVKRAFKFCEHIILAKLVEDPSRTPIYFEPAPRS